MSLFVAFFRAAGKKRDVKTVTVKLVTIFIVDSGGTKRGERIF